MYLTAQPCLHVVTNFPWPPKPDQNMLYFSLFHRPLQNSAKILQKRRYSAETGKFHGSAQNSAYRRKLWSLHINSIIDRH